MKDTRYLAPLPPTSLEPSCHHHTSSGEGEEVVGRLGRDTGNRQRRGGFGHRLPGARVPVLLAQELGDDERNVPALMALLKARRASVGLQVFDAMLPTSKPTSTNPRPCTHACSNQSVLPLCKSSPTVISLGDFVLGRAGARRPSF